MALRVELLGPLRLLVDGVPVDVPGGRRRAVLAVLALAQGREVSRTALVDELWPDDPPRDATQAVQSHVSRLRRHLGPYADRLRHGDGGYVLDLGDGGLDVADVRQVADADAAGALRHWRGGALEEFADCPGLAVEKVALDELRLRLRDDATEATIAAGTSRSADAASAVASSPLRERTVILLMRSYAVEGRTADAMHTAAAYRRRLVEETGLDPSPELGTWERLVAAGSLAPSRARTTSAVRTPAGPLVGRDQDLAELLRLLDSQPVLTVTGPGGVGKTRLTLQAAAEHSERTGAESVAVRLAAVTDGGRVPEAVAAALGLRLVGEARPATVAGMLTGRAVLLVLDNCEHVVDAVRDLVVALQERAPTVRLLTTSRVTLHVPGEFVVRLQPLALPRDGDVARLAHQPSVQAFLEHARLRVRDFTPAPGDAAVLVDVVRRLDGLPLAIELAAGQLGAVPLSALHERLGRTLDALSARRPTADARHETLRTTIDWSYRLLEPADRAVLRSLAPFPAGVDLETFEQLSAEAAPAADPIAVLARLVDHSFVDAAHDDLPRYRLLETIRAFLLDDLDARDERDAAETTFLRWASRAAAEIGTAVRGDGEAAADRRLRAELANLRAARDLSRGRGDVELRIDVTLALDDAATWRDLTELWAWAVELEQDPLLLRGNRREVAVRASAAEASWLLGDLTGAAQLARTAIEAAGDDPGAVSAWSASAAVALFRGDHARAAQDWAVAAALAVQPSPYLASGALALGYAGDRSGAAALLDDADRALGVRPCPSHRAWLRYVAGEVTAADDPGAAVVHYTAAVDLARGCGAGFIEGVAAVGLAAARAAQGDVRASAEDYVGLLRYWSAAGNLTQLWTTVRDAAVLLDAHGSSDAAGVLLLAAGSADAASALVGQAARRARGILDRIGADRVAALDARARSMTAAEVVEMAVDALRSGLGSPSVT
ncbi:BTAD domain-containing putative transcriptional regulator [Cellulomonas sp. Leaf334]|uniref:BTAD domain-containing putative transcriptional regulator n=1 Tax=Cellulomonas sp. Leaf334 TaxID=1736339 RepID=UPI0006FDC5E7|nr:BTAD domain-containing putative transcriptional regulator [Cellulomonas sp. Leaf334]KQR16482.1 hypothetical protein ASF78_03645 [Cellulomonas sp. Leaf334]